MAVFSKKNKVKTQGGPFTSYVLLRKAEFNLEKLVAVIKKDWNITVSSGSVNNEKNVLACTIDGILATVTLVRMPVPNGKAVEDAQRNFRWEEAVDVVSEHKAHLIVSVLPQYESLAKTSTIMVQLCSSCMKQSNAIAVNSISTVFAKDFYVDLAEEYIKDKSIPIWNLVFIGIYSRDEGKTISAYTYGLKLFLKDEIEILDSISDPNNIIELITDVATYVIEDDITLNDSETIGFSEEQKLQITKSESIILPFDTIKIAF